MLQEHEDAARQGIRSIEQAFRNALSLRSEPDVYRADHGVLQNDLLWKVSRCENPQLFEKIVRQEPSAVVVELLIDASGSQSVRQSMVALQSYLFSAALSRIRIPHRVMSYCTYGNYTVLRRFRDYDDKSEADRRILEYRATSNNRDGLALAAAGLDLKKRQRGAQNYHRVQRRLTERHGQRAASARARRKPTSAMPPSATPAFRCESSGARARTSSAFSSARTESLKTSV